VPNRTLRRIIVSVFLAFVLQATAETSSPGGQWVSPKFQPTVEARFEVKILKMCGLARTATWFSFICVLM